MANSKKKGNRGERSAVAVMKAWTNKEFSRVPQSGGLSWKSRDFSSGDIMCTEEGHYCPLSIEVKNYSEINFEHLLYLDNPKILDFWKQCVGDALRAKKLPFLMIRYDRLPKNFFFLLIPLDIYPLFFAPHIDPTKSRILMAGIKEHQFAILTTEDLKTIPYKKIRKPLRKYLQDEYYN